MFHGIPRFNSVTNEMNKDMIYMLSHQPGARLPAYVTAIDGRGGSVFKDGLPKEVPREVFVNFEGAEVMDRMLTSGIEIILNERSANILRGLRLPKGIVEVPCRVVGGKGVGLSYYLWYLPEEVDILDRKHSDLKMIGKHVLSVFNWVADPEKIPDVDMFLGNTNKWFVSDIFVRTVFREMLSGFGFVCIPIRNEIDSL